MKNGIAPRLLASQVAATAAWALEDGASSAAATAAARAVRDAERIEAVWEADPTSVEYLRLLLAAHYLTVATFCPTDVDARIRHHAWAALDDAGALARAVEEVDAVAALDPRHVSARVVADGGPDGPRAATLSGHDGEWLSVRAGALGRARALGGAADAAAERLEAQIEDELAREAAMFQARVRAGDAPAALSAATTLAHNAGDLSRVVEAWPAAPGLEGPRTRWARLGHAPDRARFDGVFFVAGALNKAVMALENHRFLHLRAPRALRRSRAHLLPIGPFFHAWGMALARALELEDRADVVAALLETHLSRPEQSGVLRAIAGVAEASTGPWSDLVAELPARLRKVVVAGPVRAAIGTPERAFAARLENRYRAALADAGAARDGRLA